jgi:four helix bundle protein
MKYDRFEQLPVWQAAMSLAQRIYALLDRREFARLPELRDQLRRAALSVSNNIAEGFERGSTAELLYFLYVARGSAGEVRSMLLFCQRLPMGQRNGGSQGPQLPHGPRSQISNLKSGISNFKSEISDRKPAAPSTPASPSPRASPTPPPDLAAELAALIVLAESCSRQLRGWADQLQNTDIPGQRRLNAHTRRAYH